MEGLLKVSGCDSPNRVADVIFVHGLDGDARTTWHPKDHPEAFWPAWLGEDFPAVGVWSLNYAVSSSAWKGHTMPLADRATNLLDRLDLEGIGHRPTVFIGHSLGGLLIKQLLRHACDYGNPAWKAIANQTKAIVFLSTPHSGADMASWIKYIGGLLRTTVSVEELEVHHPRLRELNSWYRNQVAGLGVKTVVYCEKRPVAGLLVVNETTADPGIPGVIPIPMDEDHISICKPVSKESQIYRRVKRLIEEIVSPR
jgi:pimeloyl-ACP methyl ester carboxylesterase